MTILDITVDNALQNDQPPNAIKHKLGRSIQSHSNISSTLNNKRRRTEIK